MGQRFHQGQNGQPGNGRGFASRVVVAVGICVVAAIGVWLLYQSMTFLLTLFGGVVMAVLLSTLAEPLTRWTRLPQWVAVMLMTVLLFGALVLAGWLLAPSISTQFDALSDQLPAAIDRIRADIQNYKWSNWIIEHGKEAPSGRTILMQVTRVFSVTLTAGAALAIITFLALYMALQPGTYTEGIIRLCPVSFRPRAREVMAELYRTMRIWLLTKLVSMAFVGVFVCVGLWLMHVPLALALGLVAGLLEFIPTIGPLLSAAPAVLIAFVQSPMTALYVALLYFVVQWVQNHVTNPLLQQKALQIPPGLSLALVAFLGGLFGFGGLMLSGPLSIVLYVLIKRLYVEDVLERRRSALQRPRFPRTAEAGPQG